MYEETWANNMAQMGLDVRKHMQEEETLHFYIYCNCLYNCCRLCNQFKSYIYWLKPGRNEKNTCFAGNLFYVTDSSMRL
jgi:hypothetical protein